MFRPISFCCLILLLVSEILSQGNYGQPIQPQIVSNYIPNNGTSTPFGTFNGSTMDNGQNNNDKFGNQVGSQMNYGQFSQAFQPAKAPSCYLTQTIQETSTFFQTLFVTSTIESTDIETTTSINFISSTVIETTTIPVTATTIISVTETETETISVTETETDTSIFPIPTTIEVMTTSEVLTTIPVSIPISETISVLASTCLFVSPASSAGPSVNAVSSTSPPSPVIPQGLPVYQSVSDFAPVAPQGIQTSMQGYYQSSVIPQGIQTGMQGYNQSSGFNPMFKTNPSMDVPSGNSIPISMPNGFDGSGNFPPNGFGTGNMMFPTGTQIQPTVLLPSLTPIV